MKQRRVFLVFQSAALVSFLLFTACGTKTIQKKDGTLPVIMDERGPYLILHTARAGVEYRQAIDLARTIHPEAGVAELGVSDPPLLLSRLKDFGPRYCLIFIKPDELDVNTAWKWLELSAALDDDPFVDLRTGFMTGESPASVFRFLKRIDDAVKGSLKLPAALIDNLGPNEGMPKDGWLKQRGSFMIPAPAAALPTQTISHGTEGFTEKRFEDLSGAGLIHFGGHGYPDRIVDFLNGPFARRVPFSPAVIFSGACYTGVTGPWFDIETGEARRKNVPAAHSFALGILSNQAVAYLAALHPDHGIPVYQEMDYLAYTGSSLGDVIKHTHDGVILAWGGTPLSLEPLEERSVPPRTPAEIMLTGTASRILYGDPAMKITGALTEPPLEITKTEETDRVTIVARVWNPSLKTTFSDTYFSDLSRTGQFNDRLLVTCDWTGVSRTPESVVVESVRAGGQDLPHRLVAWAVEQDGGQTLLHIQVDVLSTGYLDSPLRRKGAECRLAVRGRSANLN